MRLTNEQLQDVMSKNGVSRIYSWSKIDTFMNSPYEYYLKYVVKKQEDIPNSAYPTMGGICHSIIEDFYNHKIGYRDMQESFHDGWTTAIDIADLKFDRNDEVKNTNIKHKYQNNLIHFFSNHVPLTNNNMALEKFITAKINGHLLQGYIDAIYKDTDGDYHIIDWKTSTIYTGNALNEKCGQLVVYAIGLNQMGIPYDKIKICWNFLKYVTISYQQKNGTVKQRNVERCKIGEALQSNAKMWLKQYGYADECDNILQALLDYNDINQLPEEIKEKYTIADCYVYPELTNDLINKWEKILTSTITDIESREQDYEETHNENVFFDSEESVKSQSYYFATLCGYSANLHKPYKKYLEQLDANAKGDVFGNIGTQIVQSTNDNDIDLSWLNDL